MADISKIKVTTGETFDVRDYRVPVLTESINTYLRGDSTWSIPVSAPSSGILFVDGGDHLLVVKG